MMNRKLLAALSAAGLLGVSQLAPAQSSDNKSEGAKSTQNTEQDRKSAQKAGKGQDQPVAHRGPTASKELKKLLQAEDNLQRSLQALAQQPPGPKRDKALKQTRQALLETHRAMFEMPSEMRFDNSDYTKSMERLQKASKNLRQSIKMISEQREGAERDKAMEQARLALSETERAIAEVSRDSGRQGGQKDTKGSDAKAQREREKGGASNK